MKIKTKKDQSVATEMQSTVECSVVAYTFTQTRLDDKAVQKQNTHNKLSTNTNEMYFVMNR